MKSCYFLLFLLVYFSSLNKFNIHVDETETSSSWVWFHFFQGINSFNVSLLIECQQLCLPWLLLNIRHLGLSPLSFSQFFYLAMSPEFLLLDEESQVPPTDNRKRFTQRHEHQEARTGGTSPLVCWINICLINLYPQPHHVDRDHFVFSSLYCLYL